MPCDREDVEEFYRTVGLAYTEDFSEVKRIYAERMKSLDIENKIQEYHDIKKAFSEVKKYLKTLKRGRDGEGVAAIKKGIEKSVNDIRMDAEKISSLSEVVGRSEESLEKTKIDIRKVGSQEASFLGWKSIYYDGGVSGEVIVGVGSDGVSQNDPGVNKGISEFLESPGFGEIGLDPLNFMSGNQKTYVAKGPLVFKGNEYVGLASKDLSEGIAKGGMNWATAMMYIDNCFDVSYRENFTDEEREGDCFNEIHYLIFWVRGRPLSIMSQELAKKMEALSDVKEKLSHDEVYGIVRDFVVAQFAVVDGMERDVVDILNKRQSHFNGNARFKRFYLEQVSMYESTIKDLEGYGFDGLDDVVKKVLDEDDNLDRRSLSLRMQMVKLCDFCVELHIMYENPKKRLNEYSWRKFEEEFRDYKYAKGNMDLFYFYVCDFLSSNIFVGASGLRRLWNAFSSYYDLEEGEFIEAISLRTDMENRYLNEALLNDGVFSSGLSDYDLFFSGYHPSSDECSIFMYAYPLLSWGFRYEGDISEYFEFFMKNISVLIKSENFFVCSLFLLYFKSTKYLEQFFENDCAEGFYCDRYRKYFSLLLGGEYDQAIKTSRLSFPIKSEYDPLYIFSRSYSRVFGEAVEDICDMDAVLSGIDGGAEKIACQVLDASEG